MKAVPQFALQAKNYFFLRPFFSAFLLSIFLFLPSFSFGLYADDYYLWNIVRGVIFEEEKSSFWRMFFHGFTFFSGNTFDTLGLKEQGLVPWWANDALKINFFRPISSITHWFDFYFFSSYPLLMHVHSFLWFTALLWVINKWYQVLFPLVSVQNKKIVFIAILIFVLDFSHSFPYYWLSNRNIIIASFFLFSSLLFLEKAKKHFGSHYFFAMRYYCISLLFWDFALLSAESSYFSFFYFIPYVFFFFNCAFQKKVALLIPYLFILLVNLFVYHSLGYGVLFSELYLDPVKQTLLFSSSVFEKLPLYFFSSLSGVDGFYAQFSNGIKFCIWLFSFLISVFFLVLARRSIVNCKVTTFIAILWGISLFPLAGFTLYSARTLFLASIFASLFLSVVIVKSSQGLFFSSLVINRFAVRLLSGLHIWLSLFAWIILGLLSFSGNLEMKPASLNYGFLTSAHKKEVVILNHPDVMAHLYSSFIFSNASEVMPLVIGTAFQKMIVKNKSMGSGACHLLIEFEPYLITGQSSGWWKTDIVSTQSYFNPLYFGLSAASIFTPANWYIGDQFRVRDVMITVETLSAKGNVKSIDINFVNVESCNDILFLQWRNQQQQYEEINLSKLGADFGVI